MSVLLSLAAPGLLSLAARSLLAWPPVLRQSRPMPPQPQPRPRPSQPLPFNRVAPPVLRNLVVLGQLSLASRALRTLAGLATERPSELRKQRPRPPQPQPSRTLLAVA